MCALLVGRSVLSVIFSLSSTFRKWAKLLSALSAFQYKTKKKKRVSWNSVPVLFLAPCLRHIGGLRRFSNIDSCIKMSNDWLASENFKIGQDRPSNVRDWKACFWISTSSRQRASFHLYFCNAWSNGLCSSLETMPAVILSVFINSNNNKRRKLMETKDGELQ